MRPAARLKAVNRGLHSWATQPPSRPRVTSLGCLFCATEQLACGVADEVALLFEILCLLCPCSKQEAADQDNSSFTRLNLYFETWPLRQEARHGHGSVALSGRREDSKGSIVFVCRCLTLSLAETSIGSNQPSQIRGHLELDDA